MCRASIREKITVIAIHIFQTPELYDFLRVWDSQEALPRNSFLHCFLEDGDGGRGCHRHCAKKYVL